MTQSDRLPLKLQAVLVGVVQLGRYVNGDIEYWAAPREFIGRSSKGSAAGKIGYL